MLREVVDEFMTRLLGEGIACQMDGDYLVVDAKVRRGWTRRTVRRRLYVASTDFDEASALKADVVLSLRRVTDSARSALSRAGTMWLDLEAKERSEASNDLGEETALHLRRHGVRFFRVQA
jgi:hypothetical protein